MLGKPALHPEGRHLSHQSYQKTLLSKFTMGGSTKHDADSEEASLTAISIDIAFIVIFFAALFFVRPDLHKEDDKSLLEFRDPLSLGPILKNARDDENH